MCNLSRTSVVALGAGLLSAALILTSTGVSAGGSASPQQKPSAAQKGPALKVGSEAPAFSPSVWIKGDPVKAVEHGKVHVVEFWATWCGPCRQSIPHLTELQKKFKDSATFVGMASSERKSKGAKTDDRQEQVEKFVKSMGDKMGYAVAFETDGTIRKAWFEAAGQEGIPAAFVVGSDGKIAWIGHPMDPEMEKAIQAAVKPAKK